MFPEGYFEIYTCRGGSVSRDKPHALFYAAGIGWVAEPKEPAERLGEFCDFHGSVGSRDVTGNCVAVVVELNEDSFRAIENVGTVDDQKIE